MHSWRALAAERGMLRRAAMQWRQWRHARTLRTWSTHSDARCAAVVQAIHAASHMLQYRQGASAARCVRSWRAAMERREEVRRMLAVGGRFLVHRDLARGFSGLRHGVALCRAAAAAAALLAGSVRAWRRSQLAKGFRTWVGFRAARWQAIGMVRVAMAHMQRHGTGHALRSWMHHAAVSMSILRLLRLGVTRLTSRDAARAFRSWLLAARSRSNALRLVRSGLRHFIHGHVARGWAAWTYALQGWQQVAHERTAIGLSLRAWMHRQLRRSWRTLQAAHSRCLILIAIGAHAAAYWRQLGAARELRTWRAAHAMARRSVVLQMRALHCWTGLSFARHMSRWRAAAARRRGSTRLLLLGASRFVSSSAARAFGSLRANARAIAASRRMARPKLRRAFARWLSAWILQLAEACPPPHPELAPAFPRLRADDEIATDGPATRQPSGVRAPPPTPTKARVSIGGTARWSCYRSARRVG